MGVHYQEDVHVGVMKDDHEQNNSSFSFRIPRDFCIATYSVLLLTRLTGYWRLGLRRR